MSFFTVFIILLLIMAAYYAWLIYGDLHASGAEQLNSSEEKEVDISNEVDSFSSVHVQLKAADADEQKKNKGGRSGTKTGVGYSNNIGSLTNGFSAEEFASNLDKVVADGNLDELKKAYLISAEYAVA